jgi:hypothetical protein
MLIVEQNARVIKQAQKQLEKLLRRELNPLGEFLIGFGRVGSHPRRVYGSDTCPIWVSSNLLNGKNRWVNLLGFKAELKQKISSTNVVQFNFPTQGIDRFVGGVVLTEPGTNTFVIAHRGTVGGGTHGVGKNEFRAWYRHANWVKVDDDGRDSEMLVVSDLKNAHELLNRLSEFTRAVADFKAEVKKAGNARHVRTRLQKGNINLSFNPEFSGEQQRTGVASYIANCDHGKIVEDLMAWAKETEGATESGNPRPVDLIVKGRRGRVLYEVKPYGDTQSIFTGIGQLFSYNISSRAKHLVLVLPREAVRRWSHSLNILNIEALGFERRGDKFHFAY